jgi:hypothetical protein
MEVESRFIVADPDVGPDIHFIFDFESQSSTDTGQ